MKSRYDYMRASVVEDIDGEKYPDPLTINYQAIIDATHYLPEVMELNRTDLKKFWVKYYKATEKQDEDDILLTLNGVEHIGVLEPEDKLYLFDTSYVPQYNFKDLT